MDERVKERRARERGGREKDSMREQNQRERPTEPLSLRRGVRTRTGLGDGGSARLFWNTKQSCLSSTCLQRENLKECFTCIG